MHPIASMLPVGKEQYDLRRGDGSVCYKIHAFWKVKAQAMHLIYLKIISWNVCIDCWYTQDKCLFLIYLDLTACKNIEAYWIVWQIDSMEE